MRKIPTLQPLVSAVTIAAALTLAGCSGLIPTPTDLRNIQEVDRLCAKDGGIRVYEQVMLPGEFFTAKGLPKTRTLEAEYRFESKTILIPIGQGSAIQRAYDVVVRRSDGKQLGEAVDYIISWGSEHVSVPFYRVHHCQGFSSGTASPVLWKEVFLNAEGGAR